MAIVDGNGLPIAGRTESASPAEVTLVEDTLDCLWGPGYPKRFIGERPTTASRSTENFPNNMAPR
jgi:hypothetical protein